MIKLTLSLLLLLLLVVHAWSDLVEWLGIWWAFGIAYLLLCFPSTILIAKFTKSPDELD